MFGQRPLRRILAAAVMGGTLWISGCATEGGGLSLGLVSQDEVDKMSLDAWNKLRSETPATKNADYQRIASRVSGRLLTAVDENPAQWEVVVFQSSELNAFAMPGRKIGVYEGMIKFVDSEDELAAVIGHEIGHVKAQHGLKRVNSEMTTQLGVDLASVVLGGATGITANQMAALLGAGAQYGLLLPYSRSQELEADRLGLGYMAKAGYNPQQAVVLWQKMAQAQGRSQQPTFMSTHPPDDERIAQLQSLMPQAMATYSASRR